jgi:hypothetical protein
VAIKGSKHGKPMSNYGKNMAIAFFAILNKKISL